MRISLSRYNWTPEYQGKGSLFDWNLGEVVNLRSKRTGEVAKVRIDSAMKRHANALTEHGLVYEVVFLDGSGRWAVDADLIEPAGEAAAEISTGRVSLGLSP